MSPTLSSARISLTFNPKISIDFLSISLMLISTQKLILDVETISSHLFTFKASIRASTTSLTKKSLICLLSLNPINQSINNLWKRRSQSQEDQKIIAPGSVMVGPVGFEPTTTHAPGAHLRPGSTTAPLGILT